ncbi:MAG: hypothetical protein SFU98_15425 [Leptospiraceae bacterium]|nr:hypothetical protein [Leptospiraceae bacterium]
MKRIVISFLLILFCFCKGERPCSHLDSSCTSLGYILPDLVLKSKNSSQTSGNSTGTTNTTSNVDQFVITAFGGPRDIIINWAAQTGATSYKIYRKSSAGVTASDTEITNGGTTNLFFMETALTTNDLRYYRVSYLKNGIETFSKEVSANANLTNLGLFLKADSINQADNTQVTTWSDSSGNGYDATQGTGVNQPIFRTNALNGLPVIRFDGTNDFLARTIASPLLTNGTALYNHTNFFVLKRNGIGNIQHIFILRQPIQTNGSNSNEFQFTADSSLLIGSSSIFGPLNDLFLTNTSDYFIFSWRISNATANNYSSSYYRNGFLRLVHSITTGTNYSTGSQEFYIGRNSGPLGSPANQFNGDIAELIHYNRLMTETEHNQVVCYLSKKYNIATTMLSCTN